MKKKINKLKKHVISAGVPVEKQKAVKVYLSIVLLGNKMPEVADYFGLTELKVQSILTKGAFRLENNKAFRVVMHKISKAYMFNEELELVA
ncbi:hypothetical protein H9I45_14995 [Polaribacter haliotis]|uniref:Uncharacterized protein n=1 Tax=Polaribacter haliotis TaxID=1888915 RepID=A0A7L8AF35_9FLAO|nr:hypothetical protein [Polaribacter haliotis]QOD60625.1 hypothetical protein H9I45_14995 [Polaribacter haliotis]